MLRMVTNEYRMQLKKQGVMTYIKKVLFVMIIILVPKVYYPFDWLMYCVAYVVSFVSALHFSTTCTSSLPTILYLCPMDEGERVRFFRVGYVVKTLIPMALYVGIACIYVTQISWFDFLFGLLHTLMFSLALNLYMGEREVARTTLMAVKIEDQGRWGAGLLFFSLFLYSMGMLFYQAEGEVSKLVVRIFLCYELITISIFCFYMKTYYPVVKRAAASYEGEEL